MNEILNAPISSLLVIAGLICVVLAIIGRISGKIEIIVPPKRQLLLGGVGIVFLVIGLVLSTIIPPPPPDDGIIVPALTPMPTPIITPTSTPIITPTPTSIITPTSTPIITPTPTPIITPTPTPIITPTPTPKPADGIDQLPPIEWGIIETYFDISDVTLGKAEYTDVLGRVYEYDSINFIAEAKRSFYAIIIFEAEFYDEDGIKVYSSFVDFDPDYDQWQSGDRSKGHVELPSTSDMEKVRHIKISQFI